MSAYRLGVIFPFLPLTPLPHTYQGLSPRPDCRFFVAEDQAEEQAYVAVGSHGVAERSIRVQLVMIAAALAFAREVACRFEIGDDALYCPLGNPNSLCDFPQSNLWLLCDANQNVCVIAQKRPVNVRYAAT
jgi:hypothetical protein